jgi:hypothetical protein
MPVFHFDEATHTYTLDGVKVPGVTSIIEPIRPDFDRVPPDVLERKRALGTAVHLACELDDNDELESCDDVLQPYVQAWRRFKAEAGAVILANERRMPHLQLRYAGTIDRLALIDGEAWLLDLKTSAGPHPSYGVQLAGYAELLAANDGPGTVKRRASVHLFNDATFKLAEFKDPNDAAAFRACLAIYNWKENAK